MSIREMQSSRLKAFNKIKKNYLSSLQLKQYEGKEYVIIESLLTPDYQKVFLQEAWDTLVVDLPHMTKRLIYDPRYDLANVPADMEAPPSNDDAPYRDNFFYLLKLARERTLEEYSTTEGSKSIIDYYLDQIIDEFKSAFFNCRLIYPIEANSLFKFCREVKGEVFKNLKGQLRNMRLILDVFLEILFHEAGLKISRERIKAILHEKSDQSLGDIQLKREGSKIKPLGLFEVSQIVQALESLPSYQSEKKVACIRFLCSAPHSISIKDLLAITPRSINFAEASVRFQGVPFYISYALANLLRKYKTTDAKPLFTNRNRRVFTYRDLKNCLDTAMLASGLKTSISLDQLRLAHSFL